MVTLDNSARLKAELLRNFRIGQAEIAKIENLAREAFASPNFQPHVLFLEDLKKIVKHNVAILDKPNKKSVVPFESQVKVTTQLTANALRSVFDIKTTTRAKDEIEKKQVMPGKYFEIHGPGGRVKVTTSVDVMKKAKKQGIHVEMKYKMPTGKTPVKLGFYDLTSQTPTDKEQQQKALLNPESQAVHSAVEKYRVRTQTYINNLFATSSLN